jgi:hypothetical protein
VSLKGLEIIVPFQDIFKTRVNLGGRKRKEK